MLTHMPEFVSTVLQLKTREVPIPALQTLLLELNKKHGTFDPETCDIEKSNLAKRLGCVSNVGAQEDPVEFINKCIFKRLSELYERIYTDTTDPDQILLKQFLEQCATITTTSYHHSNKCLLVDKVGNSPKSELFLYNVALNGNTSILDIITNSFCEELSVDYEPRKNSAGQIRRDTTGKILYSTNRVLLPDGTLKPPLIDYPSATHRSYNIDSTGLYFIMSLKRFDNNLNKIFTHINIEDTIKIHSKSYQLKGIVLHSGGTIKGGHYVYYWRTDDPTKWKLISDNNIVDVTSSSSTSSSTSSNYITINGPSFNINMNGYIFLYKHVNPIHKYADIDTIIYNRNVLAPAAAAVAATDSAKAAAAAVVKANAAANRAAAAAAATALPEAVKQANTAAAAAATAAAAAVKAATAATAATAAAAAATPAAEAKAAIAAKEAAAAAAAEAATEAATAATAAAEAEAAAPPPSGTAPPAPPPPPPPASAAAAAAPAATSSIVTTESIIAFVNKIRLIQLNTPVPKNGSDRLAYIIKRRSGWLESLSEIKLQFVTDVPLLNSIINEFCRAINKTSRIVTSDADIILEATPVQKSGYISIIADTYTIFCKIASHISVLFVTFCVGINYDVIVTPTLITSGQLTVAAYKNFEPVSFIHEGQDVGLDVDLIKLYYSNSIFNTIPTFNNIWNKPAEGTADISIGGIGVTRDRLRSNVEWTIPYFYVKRTLVYNNKFRIRQSNDSLIPIKLNSIADAGQKWIQRPYIVRTDGSSPSYSRSDSDRNFRIRGTEGSIGYENGLRRKTMGKALIPTPAATEAENIAALKEQRILGLMRGSMVGKALAEKDPDFSYITPWEAWGDSDIAIAKQEAEQAKKDGSTVYPVGEALLPPDGEYFAFPCVRGSGVAESLSIFIAQQIKEGTLDILIRKYNLEEEELRPVSVSTASGGAGGPSAPPGAAGAAPSSSSAAAAAAAAGGGAGGPPPSSATSSAAAASSAPSSSAAPAAATSVAPTPTGVLTPLYYKTVPGNGDCFYLSLYEALIERPEVFERAKILFKLTAPFTREYFNDEVRAFTVHHQNYIDRLYKFYEGIYDLINNGYVAGHIIETLQSGTTRVQRAALGLSIEDNIDGSYSLKDKSGNIIYNYSIYYSINTGNNEVENITVGPGKVNNIKTEAEFLQAYHAKFLEKTEGAGAYAAADEVNFIKDILLPIKINVTYIIANQNLSPQLLNANQNDNIFLFNDGINHYNYFSITPPTAAPTVKAAGGAGRPSAPPAAPSAAPAAPAAAAAAAVPAAAAATAVPAAAAAAAADPNIKVPDEIYEAAITANIEKPIKAPDVIIDKANRLLNDIKSDLKNATDVTDVLTESYILKIPFFSQYSSYSDYYNNPDGNFPKLIEAIYLKSKNLYVIHQYVEFTKVNENDGEGQTQPYVLFRPHAFYINTDQLKQFNFYGKLHIYNYRNECNIDVPIINIEYHKEGDSDILNNTLQFSPANPAILLDANGLDLQDGINHYYVRFEPREIIGSKYPNDTVPLLFEGIFLIEKQSNTSTNISNSGIIRQPISYTVGDDPPQLAAAAAAAAAGGAGGPSKLRPSAQAVVGGRRQTRSKRRNQRKRTLKR
jgi:hypothetical protein